MTMIKSVRARHAGQGLRFTIATGSGHELAVDDALGDAQIRTDLWWSGRDVDADDGPVRQVDDMRPGRGRAGRTPLARRGGAPGRPRCRR